MDVEIIGFVAALITTSAFVPQVIKVWKSKRTYTKVDCFIML